MGAGAEKDMIILPNSVFYHVPKTGGSWIAEGVREAFKTYRIPYGHAHSSPLDYGPGELPSFCFVRHPDTWYRSYKNSTGKNIIEMINGSYLTNLYKQFKTTRIGRFESLKEDLRKILSEFKEQYDGGAMFDRPPVNVSEGRELTDEAKELIRTKEQWVFETFDYA